MPWFGRTVVAATSALVGNGRSRMQLERLRDARLRQIVRHAYRSVPFYRELWGRHAVDPAAIRSVADLGHLPTTDKVTMQSHPARQLVASGLDPARLLARSTSGSDGRPLLVYRTWWEQNLLHLFRLRAQRSVGLRLSDRFVTIGLLRTPLSGDDKRVGRLLRGLGLYRRSRIDTFQDLDDIVEEVRRLRPDVLGGYPGVLARVADRIGELGEARPRPRLLLSGAEVLTPLYRRRIEAGLGAPVYDMYGCHELNLVAWECRTSGELHTCDDALAVEVLDGNRPVEVGERGEVVVTGLYSFAMPFIRYRLGDIAVRGQDRCFCGQPFATLREIEGRTFEHFDLPDGRTVHPHLLGRLLLSRDGPAIRQYQVTQERPDLVRIRIVLEASRSLDIETLESRMQDVLGPSVRCEVLLAGEIPMEPSGKYRIYRSLTPERSTLDHPDTPPA